MALKKKLSTRKSPAKVKKSAKKQVLKKKPIKNKATKKLSTRKSPAKTKTEGNLIGSITHYFPHVQAAVIKLKGPLAIGETIKIKGHTTDLTQAITSMQMDRVNISNAKKGMEIGVQVSARVRHGDKVYKS